MLWLEDALLDEILVFKKEDIYPSLEENIPRLVYKHDRAVTISYHVLRHEEKETEEMAFLH